jgi:VWFA-related protein
VAIAFGVLPFFGTHWMMSQDSPYTINLDVNDVSVDFTVVDAKGNAVTDLTGSDFEVFDNGMPRPIKSFSPVQTPYNMAMLLDCSGSTQNRVKMLIQVMARFADQFRPQDKAMLAIFGSDVEVVWDWNGNNKQPTSNDSAACNGSGFYNALNWVVKKFRGISGRRGAVVLSDGADSDMARKTVKIDGFNLRRIVPPEEDREFQKLLKTVRESNISFNFVAVNTDKNPGKDYNGPVPDLQQIRARMEMLALATGGRISYPISTGEVAPMIHQIGQDLGISYSLAFSPANDKDKGSHQFEIRTRTGGYTVSQNKTTYVVQ